MNYKDARWRQKQGQKKNKQIKKLNPTLTGKQNHLPSLVPTFIFAEIGQDEGHRISMFDNLANGSISRMWEIRLKESSDET